MTDQATETTAPAQSVNGSGPLPEAPEADTGERWLGVLVIAAGCFLLLVGFDRLSGGRITAALSGAGDDAAG